MRCDKATDDTVAASEECAVSSTPGLACPVPTIQRKAEIFNADLCQTLDHAGCPLASTMRTRFEFETLLAELSAKFVNVPAGQVDSQIESGLRLIVEHLQIDRSGLGEVSPDGNRFLVTHSFQVPGIPGSKKFILDSQFPVYAKMIRQGVVVRLPDDLPAEAVGEREYCQQSGLKSNLTVPLVVRGSVVGGIGFSSFRSRRVLPDELIPRLRLVGDIFTNALARKRADEALGVKERLLNEAKEGLRQLTSKLILSQEEERARIAREMHDDWTQRLAMLGIDAATIEDQLGAGKTALPLLQAMRQSLVSLADDVHALSRHLHPSIIGDLGLAEALRSECTGFSRREEITVHYVVNQLPLNLPNDIALCIYRVAQECLRNLAKHAAVSEASVTLTVTGRELRLSVSDQGIGFHPETIRSQPGLGLSSIEERVHLISGKLMIRSAPGNGTTIEVRVPLEGIDS